MKICSVRPRARKSWPKALTWSAKQKTVSSASWRIPCPAPTVPYPGPRATRRRGAALLVSEAAGDHTLPYAVAAVTADMPQGLRGLEALPDAMLLKYRSAAREFLFKADIASNAAPALTHF